MWNVEMEIIPTAIGEVATITKLCRKYLSNITGMHDNKELQKTAILGTAHIIRKVVM
jgi:hypothetical protein